MCVSRPTLCVALLLAIVVVVVVIVTVVVTRIVNTAMRRDAEVSPFALARVTPPTASSANRKGKGDERRETVEAA